MTLNNLERIGGQKVLPGHELRVCYCFRMSGSVCCVFSPSFVTPVVDTIKLRIPKSKPTVKVVKQLFFSIFQYYKTPHSGFFIRFSYFSLFFLFYFSAFIFTIFHLTKIRKIMSLIQKYGVL